MKEIDPKEIKEKSKKYKKQIETLKEILKKFDDIIDLSLIEQETKNKMSKKEFKKSFYVLMAEGYIFKPDSKSVKVLKNKKKYNKILFWTIVIICIIALIYFSYTGVINFSQLRLIVKI